MKKYLHILLFLLLGVVTEAYSQSKTISGGNDHGLIICAQGYLYTWGNNFSSSIGGPLLGIDPDVSLNANDKIVYSPQRVKTDGLTFSMVTSGSGAHNVALSCHKVVYCWGDNSNKGCGQGAGANAVVAYPSPVLKGETPGYTLDGQPGGDYLGGVVYIAASTNSSFAIMNDGRVVGWGGGSWNSKTGAAAGLPSYIKDKSGNDLTNVTHISGGDDNLLIRTGDGKLYGIGPWNGQTEDAVTYAVPVLKSEDDTPLTDIRMSAAADVAGYAVTGDGFVWAWGNGGWGGATGQAASGNSDPKAKKVISGEYESISGEEYLTDVKEVIGGRGHGAAVTKEGYLVYWGCIDENGGTAPVSSATVADWKSGSQGVKPVLARYCDASGKAGQLVTDAVSVSRGDNFDFMINDKDEFYVWGINDVGQTGTGNASVVVYNCLTKLETIPCEIQDACPTVFMIDRTKCPGEEIELDCGYVVPIGKEERYYITWWHDGVILNTSTKNSSKTDRLADEFNVASIYITEPGTYKVKVEYIGGNIPCDACEPDSTTITVTDMKMPVDTIITEMNCVADPLSPSASDMICFQATVNDAFYKATQDTKFAAFSTETSKDTLEVMTAKGAGGELKFCVTGDKISKSEVHDNKDEASNDTTYTVWLEDISSFDTYLYKDNAQTMLKTGGSFQSYGLLIDQYADADLKSFQIAAKSYSGNTNISVTPVVYTTARNTNGQYVPDGVFWKGKAQTFTIDDAGPNYVTVDCNVRLPGNAARGVRYILGMTFTGNCNLYTFATGANKQNSPEFVTPIIDSEKFGIYAMGATANSYTESANGSNTLCYANVKFGKLTDYDCGRIRLTARYGCPPCNKPDGIVKIDYTYDGVKKEVDPSSIMTLYMCHDDYDVTFSVSNVKSAKEPTAQFDILWFENEIGTETDAIQVDKKATGSALPPISWTEANAGKTIKYIVQVRDNEKPTSSDCYVYDSIKIQFNPKPDVPEIDDIAFCENAVEKTVLSDALASDAFDGFSVSWYSDVDMKTISAEPDLSTLKAEDSPFKFYYNVRDTVTEYGCQSDVDSFEVKVYDVPDDNLTPLDPFCKNAEVKLPSNSTKQFEITWYDADGIKASNDLSTLDAGVYTYQYTLTSADPENCVSDKSNYNFTVKDFAQVTLDTTKAMNCGITTVTATLTPSTATTTWKLNGNTITSTDATSTEFKYPTYSGKVGELKVKVSADDYCDSTSEALDLYVRNPADIPTVQNVTYLKSDAVNNAFKNVMEQSQNAAVAEEYGYTLNWYDADKKDLGEVPTPPFPEESVTDDQHYSYFVSRTNEDGCESDTTTVHVTVYLTPAPTPKHVFYCKGSKNVKPLEAEVNDPTNIGGYTLVWYDTNGTELTQAPTPKVDAAGKFTYKVSQKSAAGALSSPVELNVTVYDVDKPSLDDANILKYCASSSETASPLTATLKSDVSVYKMANDLVWQLKDDAGDYQTITSAVPTIDVKETTTYDYQVYQTYTIATTGEVCTGAPVQTSVKVIYVAPVTTKEVLYLKASANADGTFGNNLIEQDAEAVTNITSGATLQWYDSDCKTEIEGTPTPKVDPSVKEGEEQNEVYCVSQVIDGCYSTSQSVPVRISDALPPTTYAYNYCEGQKMSDLSADINVQGSTLITNYELYWYGKNQPASTTVQPEYVGEKYAMNSAEAKVEGGSVTVYTYWVAQHDISTDAVSVAQPVTVTVYPKPIVVVEEQPKAVCEENVDLSKFVKVNNTSETVVYTYYKDGNDLSSSVVPMSGTFTADATYQLPVQTSAYVIAANKECRGGQETIKVAIHDLSVNPIDGVNTTCPGTSVTLKARATSTDPGTITYSWTGDAAQVADGSTTGETLKTKNLSENTGDKYTFHLTAEAGACKKDAPTNLVVEIGQGQVLGTLFVEEPNNEFSGMSFSNTDEAKFYSCGNKVTMTVNYDGDKDYQWYVGDNLVSTGSKLETDKYDTYSDVTYTVKFTNICPTSREITIHAIPVKATPVSQDSIAICEGVEFKTSFDYTLKPGETPAIYWYRDGAELGGAKTKVLTIANTTNSDDGHYSYKIVNRGCEDTGNANILNVKPFINAKIQEEPFIIPRHGTATLPLTYVVPSNGAISSQKWMEKDEVVADGNPFVINDVISDHYYDIILSDPEYCDDTLKAIIYVDAELQLSTDLKDTLCLGTSEVLTIDTTGTGNFRDVNGNPQLNIIQVIGGTRMSLNDRITKQGDLLKVTVNPADKAKYEVLFTYGSQSLKSEEEVLVIPAISLTTPDVPNICEGSETTLSVSNVSPEGTTVSWTEDPTIIEGQKSNTVRVKPTYTGGADHQSLYTYTVVAYNAFCDNTRAYTVQVLVDEPLKGNIEGESEICEGESTFFDASSYEATYYNWHPDSLSLAPTPMLQVQPIVSTDYVVDMSRGLCAARDTFTVTVHTNPVIQSIDSVGLRDRQIMLVGGLGTAPFTYAIDAFEADNNDVKKDLTFSKHVVYVYDVYGCTTSETFRLSPPSLDIPVLFTPNGDGNEDNWIVANLTEVYPNAVVRIYDRFGKLIAQFLGADADGWDGTYRGAALPSTDYWYQITIEEIDQEYVGHFTLIRR